MTVRPAVEYFEIFDDRGHLCGRMARDEVHRSGWWHRSADVWLFRSDGALLLQQRARDKDLYPGRWDYSVGEHLLPGESFPMGAKRGLYEELGVCDVVLAAVGGLRRVVTEDARLGIRDRELARSFRVRCDEDLRPAASEVQQVQWVRPGSLHDWMRREPQAFTPWFIAAVAETGILDGLPSDSP